MTQINTHGLENAIHTHAKPVRARFASSHLPKGCPAVAFATRSPGPAGKVASRDRHLARSTAVDYSGPESEAYRAALKVIEGIEPRVAEATRKELADQRSSLKLIASENYASPAVLLTMGTWLSDKYAEGTIGHRFYAGCQNVDTVEALAAEHARELFGAEYAYAQPHSGIDANLVAFWAILAHRIETPELAELGLKGVNDMSEEQWETLRHKFGNQRALGMSLDAGGHLTHGFRPNISGKIFHQRSYGTIPRPNSSTTTRSGPAAQEFKPLILIAGYSAYPRR